MKQPITRNKRTDDTVPRAVLDAKPVALDVLARRIGKPLAVLDSAGVRPRWSRKRSGEYFLAMSVPEGVGSMYDGRTASVTVTAQGKVKDGGGMPVYNRMAKPKPKAATAHAEAEAEAALDLVADMSPGAQRLLYKALKLKLGE